MVFIFLKHITTYVKILFSKYIREKFTIIISKRTTSRHLIEAGIRGRTSHLRKLIKYEERMGVNTQQNYYFESLFRRTTASYRAKIDRKNYERSSEKRKSSGTPSSSSKQEAAVNRKVLNERNHRETSTSFHNLLDSFQTEKNVKETKTDADSLKLLIEKTLEQILHEKYCQEFVDKNHNNNISKENSPIKSIVEEVLKGKISDLRHSTRERLNSSGPGALRSIIEDTITKVLYEKLGNLEKENSKSDDRANGVENLNQDFQQKLKLNDKQTISLPREAVTQYNNTSKPLDSQSLVQQLLSFEEADIKKGKSKTSKSRADKENSTTPSTDGRIKRLQRSPRKKPEWQDPSLHNKMMDKPLKVIRSQSPVVSSGSRSGRSKASSSVLIRRPKSQGRNRKPNSDPVALYQYYKNEWENFRHQIPGESPHSSLRWHVRQRLLDFD